jgi:hypothetical protein
MRDKETKSERRQKRSDKKKYGMRVSNRSIFLLEKLGRKRPPRKRKKRKKRKKRR